MVPAASIATQSICNGGPSQQICVTTRHGFRWPRLGRSAKISVYRAPGVPPRDQFPATEPLVARFFAEARSMHLERAPQMAPAVTFYLRRRGDFDIALGNARPDFKQTSRLKLIRDCSALKPDILELPEPLCIQVSVLSVLLAVSCRTRNQLAGRKLRTVAYAIENSDPSRYPRVVPERLRWAWLAMARGFARMHARQLSEIVFGTEGARDAYVNTVGQQWASNNGPPYMVVPAIPSACPCADLSLKEKGATLFLGDLHARKGLDILLAAWNQLGDAVQEHHLSLTIVGTGDLSDSALQASMDDPSITYLGSLVRERVHAELNRAAIVLLPSQPGNRWREQVGLPITEGLAHGCLVITTNETGLASELRNLGHVVVKAPTTSDSLRESIVKTQSLKATASSLLERLPVQDGRITAERWLIGRHQ